MDLTITVELKIKGDEAEVFVNGEKVATVATNFIKAEEEKVGAISGSKLTDFEYTGAKHSRKELEELLGVAFVREHEEHLKSRMK
jgi:hypothetical protein